MQRFIHDFCNSSSIAADLTYAAQSRFVAAILTFRLYVFQFLVHALLSYTLKV